MWSFHSGFNGCTTSNPIAESAMSCWASSSQIIFADFDGFADATLATWPSPVVVGPDDFGAPVLELPPHPAATAAVTARTRRILLRIRRSVPADVAKRRSRPDGVRAAPVACLGMRRPIVQRSVCCIVLG